MTVVGRITRPPNAIVAAASRKQIGGHRHAATDTTADHLWGLYDALGEIGYGVNFKSNAAARITYLPAIREQPQDDPEPVDTPQVVEAFRRVQGPLGEFADFIAELVTHLNVIGEGYLIGQTRSSLEEWDVWSTSEYGKAQQTVRKDHPDDVEPLTPDDFALRVWRPHPQRRSRADSPLRRVQTEAEQLIYLSGMVTSITRSRLPAKILGVPDELSFASPVERGDMGANMDEDPFIAELVEAMTTAVRETSSAARIVPLVIRGPGNLLSQIVVVDPARELPEWASALQERVVRRLASGLDLPAEILLGMGDINHWGAWQIEESAYKAHVDPDILLVLDSLTRGYLWPTLEEAGVADHRRFLLWRDPSDLIARPLSIADTITLYQTGVVSAEATRRIVGLSEDDAPGPTETPTPAPPRENETGPDTVDQGPPPSAVTAAAGIIPRRLAQIDRTLFDKIDEAAQAALDRALERAGARIRNQAKKDRAVLQKLSGVDNMAVAATLGEGIVERLQLTADELLPEGTFDRLRSRVERLLRRGQDETHQETERLVGEPLDPEDDQRESWVKRAVEAFIVGMMAVGIARLFRPDAGPDPADTGEIGDTNIPADLIWDTLTLAAGGEPADLPDQPRGLAFGQQTRRWFTDHGLTETGRIWEYGDRAARHTNYEPHYALDGIRFGSWIDEQLRAADQWLGVSHMFPGDHRGCRCTTIPILEVT